jgi:hypothetical protein
MEEQVSVLDLLEEGVAEAHVVARLGPRLAVLRVSCSARRHPRCIAPALPARLASLSARRRALFHAVAEVI